MEMRRSRQWAAWTALAASVSAYAAVSLLLGQPFHAGGMPLRFFDLRIYHLGALALVHGRALYGAPMLKHLGFTYPPFAALILAPLAWLPLRADELLVTGLNLALLVVILRRALLLMPQRSRLRRLAPAAAWSAAAALAGAALWLEPISVTVGYGQINLLITALVLWDLSRPDGARGTGIAIGLAAAIKLTPLLFIPYLLGSRRRREAAVAALTFAGTIALSFAVTPADARTYWLHRIVQTSRIGNPIGVPNQSLTGALARLTGVAHLTLRREMVVIAIVLGGLALAVGASRRGDEAAGFSLTAISTLLASPISWSHHWTLAVPALVLLALRGYEQRSRALLTGAAVLALAGYGYLPEIAEGSFRSVRGPASLLSTNPYALCGVLILAITAVSLARARLRHSGAWPSLDRTTRPPRAVSGRALTPAVR